LSNEAVERKLGKFSSTVTIPGGLLKAGTYYATFGADIKNGESSCRDDLLQFDVIESADDTLAERHKRLGSIAPLLKWEISEAEPAAK